MATPAPDLTHERRLLRAGATLVAGMDEVGRGAIAGPVSVGVVVVDAATRSAPKGVRDSKVLTPAAREELAPRIRRWSRWHAVGHASSAEIDEVGIIAALRLAGMRALAALDVAPDVVILDGSHDWLTPPPPDLFATDDAAEVPRVCTLVRGDQRCSSVAAASVLAKTERDAMVRALAAEHPDYGWAENKGYATPEHLAALRELGACQLHRRSWDLPA